MPQSSFGFLLDNSFKFFSAGKNPARKSNSLLHPTKTEKATQRISQSTRLAIHGGRFSCCRDQCKSTNIECYKPAGCGSSSNKSFNGSAWESYGCHESWWESCPLRCEYSTWIIFSRSFQEQNCRKISHFYCASCERQIVKQRRFFAEVLCDVIDHPPNFFPTHSEVRTACTSHVSISN